MTSAPSRGGVRSSREDKAEVLVALLAARPGVGEYDVSVPAATTSTDQPLTSH